MDEAAKNEVFRERFPAGRCDVAANETWLEDQARAGYRLTGLVGEKAEFVADAPQACRFRMEPLAGKKEPLDRERETLYNDLGWVYVGVLAELFRVWRSDDPTAPELHTDPVVQGAGYRYFKGRMLRNTLGLLLVCLGLAALLLWGMLRSDTPLMDLLNAPPGRLTLMLLWIPMTVALDVRELWGLRRLWRLLSAGVPLKRPRSYRRQRWLTTAATVLTVLVVLLPLVTGGHTISGSSLTGGWKARDKETGRPKETVLYLDVSRLEGGTGEADYFSVTTKVHELAPRSYHVRQYLPLEGKAFAWSDSSYVRLLTPGLAEALVWELTEHYDGTLAAVETTALDALWWNREENGDQYAVARLGRAVLVVGYRGDTDLRQAETALAAVIQGDT